jgi:hypothetical protein
VSASNPAMLFIGNSRRPCSAPSGLCAIVLPKLGGVNRWAIGSDGERSATRLRSTRLVTWHPGGERAPALLAHENRMRHSASSAHRRIGAAVGRRADRDQGDDQSGSGDGVPQRSRNHQGQSLRAQQTFVFVSEADVSGALVPPTAALRNARWM